VIAVVSARSTKLALMPEPPFGRHSSAVGLTVFDRPAKHVLGRGIRTESGADRPPAESQAGPQRRRYGLEYLAEATLGAPAKRIGHLDPKDVP
jgi:hypothetical protein